MDLGFAYRGAARCWQAGHTLRGNTAALMALCLPRAGRSRLHLFCIANGARLKDHLRVRPISAVVWTMFPLGTLPSAILLSLFCDFASLLRRVVFVRETALGSGLDD